MNSHEQYVLAYTKYGLVLAKNNARTKQYLVYAKTYCSCEFIILYDCFG